MSLPDTTTAAYALKREFWRASIDSEVQERREKILGEQARGRPVAWGMSASEEAFQQLLNEAAGSLHAQQNNLDVDWRNALERVTLLLAWGRLA